MMNIFFKIIDLILKFIITIITLPFVTLGWVMLMIIIIWLILYYKMKGELSEGDAAEAFHMVNTQIIHSWKRLWSKK